MTKKEAFEEINRLQDGYVDELISKLNDPDYQTMKTINFTSATGTGKTKMMSKLINKLPEYFFIVTTLSKGQLKYQIQDSLLKDCVNDNYSVYGSSDYTISSILKEEDIIGKIPSNRKCIWLRDEGHIRTNRFEEILSDKCYKIINFSATNVYSDIQCNFMQTMMLRTVYQTCGSPEDAINKLIEVKRIHRNVHDYNPCAIFRCVSGNEYIYDNIVDLCRKHNLKYIDITDESFVMSELCKDDNQYDIIINKYKISEGIDIRRAHVLYMDNQPGNNATTIQVIGRCRRNALLYRKDIDILDPRNKDLLKETRKCYVYYNVKEMRIPTDADGNLQNEYCDHISCQSIKAGSYIDVENGQLPNGLYVVELEGKTGRYKVSIDNNTGFNYINPVTEYYARKEKYCSSLINTRHGKIDVKNVKLLPIRNTISVYDNDIKGYIKKQVDPYYDLCSCDEKSNVKTNVSENIINEFQEYMKKYTYEYIFEKIKNNCLDVLLQEDINYSTDQIKLKISGYIKKNKKLDESKEMCRLLLHINEYYFTVSGFEYQLQELCTKDELLLLMEKRMKSASKFQKCNMCRVMEKLTCT